MTKPAPKHRHEQFLIQLENFRNDADAIAQYLYAGMSINYGASKSKKLLARLNQTPLFWKTVAAATQSSAYIGIARVFDGSSQYNINKLLQSIESNLSDFSRAALAERKKAVFGDDLDRLNLYLETAYYPKLDDIVRLRKHVAAQHKIYERMIYPVRNQYLAHRRHTDHQTVSALYAQGKVKELWKLATFLLAFHDALWQLYHNGRKPIIRQGRYSVKSIYDTKKLSGATHERIIGETRSLMNSLIAKTA